MRRTPTAGPTRCAISLAAPSLEKATCGETWPPSAAAWGRVSKVGVNCLNPIEPPPNGDVTLAQARAVVGDRMCLEGNIEADDLFRGTPARIRALVRQAIEEARGGPFILCPTSGFMEWPVCNPEKVANYLALIEAGLEYGQEPG